ncbi:MAG: glycosyltransferase family 2 protein [Candidatus Hydrogenedentota bacterium]|nr:MAG: glycosyltransferase family 2 protein [Candidatus Hydrogenedentota bacterium]
MAKIAFVIPALNEEKSLPFVLQDLPKPDKNHIVIVADNGSTDKTAEIAKKYNAIVVSQPTKGYGIACLTALAELQNHHPDTDVVVFLDGDYSDSPKEWKQLVNPILHQNYDFVLGSRVLGMKQGMTEKGALLPQARFGNLLSTFLIRLFWKERYTDLGPFRAIRYASLQKLNMQDKNFGWTVEMQIRAVKANLKILEIPVSYKKRIGVSKVTGTIKGSVMAGIIILKTIFKELFASRSV